MRRRHALFLFFSALVAGRGLLASLPAPTAPSLATPAALFVREYRDSRGGLCSRWHAYRNASGREVKQGEYIDFYADGARKTRVVFENDEVRGHIVSYHPNGRTRSETLPYTVMRTGRERYWYASGVLEAEFAYKNGKVIEWSRWYENGGPRTVSRQSLSCTLGGEPVQVTEQTHFYESGSRYAVREYRAGRGWRATVWDKTGNRIYPK
jgi:hypothetical protein